MHAYATALWQEYRWQQRLGEKYVLDDSFAWWSKNYQNLMADSLNCLFRYLFKFTDYHNEASHFVEAAAAKHRSLLWHLRSHPRESCCLGQVRVWETQRMRVLTSGYEVVWCRGPLGELETYLSSTVYRIGYQLCDHLGPCVIIWMSSWPSTKLLHDEWIAEFQEMLSPRVFKQQVWI